MFLSCVLEAVCELGLSSSAVKVEPVGENNPERKQQSESEKSSLHTDGSQRRTATRTALQQSAVFRRSAL